VSKYNAASLVTALRERIGLEREAVLTLNNLDESSLRRIEGEKQNPKPETLESLMKTIDLPLEGFIYSLLDDQPMGVYLLCDRLTQVLDIGDAVTGESLLHQLEVLPGFDTGVLLQFILSKKARLWELQGKPSSLILPLIEAGMAETFYGFNEADIVDKVLVLEEPELMHTKARIYAKEGKYDAAIGILKSMMSSLISLPTADREKEKQFAPVLLSLSNCLIQTGDYDKVLEICELGSEYSAARRYGELNPDFEINKALALRGLDRRDECRAPLQHAYFGYILLGETGKAKEVFVRAKEDFEIQFNLFGVDKLDFSSQPKIPYNRGESVICDSIGSMVFSLRKKANLSLDQLCRGICNKSTLSRIERGDLPGQYFTLEAIMQRLGRDIGLYSNFFLSKEDFVAMQLRDRIYILIIEKNYTYASRLLKEVETLKSFIRHNVNKQFIKTMEVFLLTATTNGQHLDIIDLLLDAVRVTCPQFDENNIDSYNLTYNEIMLINRYASLLGNAGDLSRTAKIYERLLRNLNTKYVDELERSRMYSTVLFNYSSCLGRLGRLNEAMATISEGEHFERIHKRLIDLPGLIFNKGFGMMVSGRINECIPHIALAYYGTAMFADYGQATCLATIYETAKEHLGITFD
jgi:transcriptional regulator with XRE-family HTH domain